MIPKWIKLKDNKPHNMQQCLVFTPGRVIELADWELARNAFVTYRCGYDGEEEKLLSRATHWMKVPEPPRASEL